MDGEDVIEGVSEIYDKFGIPESLRKHMLRVAGVGSIICDNWSGPRIDQGNVVSVCLIHDLGNLAKIDLDRQSSIDMLEKDTDIENLRRVKEEMEEKYGRDHVKMTLNMSRELGVNERLFYLLRNREFVLNDSIMKSDDWELKICAYSDQRVAPAGVVSLKERFDEADQRYKDLKAFPKKSLLQECAFRIEEQIFSNSSIEPEDINDKTITPYVQSLISTS